MYNHCPTTEDNVFGSGLSGKEATGMIFDIVEFSLYDGPGIRTTVFFKGCPLRCTWCHNPEGLFSTPQIYFTESKCMQCGECRKACTNFACIACGKCVRVCPAGAREIVGREISAELLSREITRNNDLYRISKGGVTFSGGEPLAQSAFLLAVLDQLDGIHTVLETCGYCEEEIFRKVIGRIDLVLFDVKHIDAGMHRVHTGVSNIEILHNLTLLNEMEKDLIIRIPLIPGVNDSKETMQEIAYLLKGFKALRHVELLPYHRTAGMKYRPLNMKYEPGFDEKKDPLEHVEVFHRCDIMAQVL